MTQTNVIAAKPHANETPHSLLRVTPDPFSFPNTLPRVPSNNATSQQADSRWLIADNLETANSAPRSRQVTSRALLLNRSAALAINIAESLKPKCSAARKEHIDLDPVPVRAFGGTVAGSNDAVAGWRSIGRERVRGIGIMVAVASVVEAPVEVGAFNQWGGICGSLDNVEGCGEFACYTFFARFLDGRGGDREDGESHQGEGVEGSVMHGVC